MNDQPAPVPSSSTVVKPGRGRILAWLTLVAVVCHAGALAATLDTYADRTAWNLALAGAPVDFVDFETFGADAGFHAVPVDAGPFSLLQVEGIPNLFNRIDVPPYYAVDAPACSPDGTTFCFMSISGADPPNGTSVEIVFDRPTLAFGADFRTNNNPGSFAHNRWSFETSGGSVVTSVDTLDGFFGVIASEPFTSVTIFVDPVFPHSMTFGMDNVVSSSSCGNDRLDGGEDCDGSLDDACRGECSATCECPLSVELVSFTAASTHRGVELRFSTATERDNVGFRLLRVGGGAKREQWIPVSPLIPAAGTGLTGASYEFLDVTEPSHGWPVYYLEDIDVFGKVTLHGPVEPRRGRSSSSEAVESNQRQPTRRSSARGD